MCLSSILLQGDFCVIFLCHLQAGEKIGEDVLLIPGRILNYCLNHCFTFLTIQIYSSVNLTLYSADLADNEEQ